MVNFNDELKNIFLPGIVKIGSGIGSVPAVVQSEQIAVHFE